VVPTELGTLADLVETVAREAPTGIHFSGHGKPGALLFENDEGGEDEVAVERLLERLRQPLPDARPLPPFFYLASCHGNDPARLEEDEAGSASAVVQLHRAGVAEVVGYFGPIVDALSTRAEVALYEGIAEGLPTRDAVRRARAALAQPLGGGDERQRPSSSTAAPVLEQDLGIDPFPFAWALTLTLFDPPILTESDPPIVCRAIWDSDATINETRFDRAETRCRDPCAVSHNRLW
jgi:hypothetical protein